MPNHIHPLLALAALIGVSLAAGAIGGVATAGSIEGWYRTLTMPALNPPPWVFGPVWTTLYILMGVAAWLVWREADSTSVLRWPMTLFFAQLALNALWSVLFFGAKRLDLAFAELVVLWAAIVATIVVFSQRSTWAAALLAPYLAWVSFAGYLNLRIWQLNR